MCYPDRVLVEAFNVLAASDLFFDDGYRRLLTNFV